MSSLTDRTIAANRATQDRLGRLVEGMSDEDLRRPSGATEWTVAQVLSHLGSGAEIALDTFRAAQAGAARPAEANGPVWDRWNAMAPREQAAGFLRTGEELLAAVEALDAQQRERLRLPLPFLPEPADLALFTGMRLNEAALHAWDVEVAFDPAAVIPEDVAAVLLDQARGPLSFLLGFAAKPDQLGGRSATLLVLTSAPDTRLGLALSERVALTEAPARSDGELHLATEALLRLIAGRLRPEHTPSSADVSGPVGLDDLRRVFPGF